MKRKQTLHRASYDCLVEALRRTTRFGNPEDPTAHWTGLGYASQYKEAVDQGVMRVDGSYGKRCPGWYHLTPLGVEIVKAWLALGYTHVQVEEVEDRRSRSMVLPYDVANEIFQTLKEE